MTNMPMNVEKNQTPKHQLRQQVTKLLSAIPKNASSGYKTLNLCRMVRKYEAGFFLPLLLHCAF
jgi:hypothetical protein